MRTMLLLLSLLPFIHLHAAGHASPPPLLEFSALKQEGRALLNWTLFAEANIRSYTLERSADGRHFTPVHEVTVVGRGNYRYMDEAPMDGDNYYRLRSETLDRIIEYTEIKRLQFDEVRQVSVFPNPAADRFHIRLPASWKGAFCEWQLRNAFGQVVIAQQVTGAAGMVDADVRSLPGGVYWLSVSGADKRFVTTMKIMR
jgi:hypothetical protein